MRKNINKFFTRVLSNSINLLPTVYRFSAAILIFNPWVFLALKEHFPRPRG